MWLVCLRCARRELQEESGLALVESQLELCGKLHFVMQSDGMVDKESGVTEGDMHVHVRAS